VKEGPVLERNKAWAMSALTSSIVTTLINGPLTVIKELSPLMGTLKAVFGHHWTGQGVILLIIFIALTLGSYPYYKGRSISEPTFKKLTLLLVAAVFIMLFLILGFFIYEYQI